MQTLFRQIRKPLYPIIILPGIFLLAFVFYLCTICSMGATFSVGNLDMRWNKDGSVIFNGILIILVMAFIVDMIRCTKWKVKKELKDILKQSGNCFRILDIQVIDGIGILRLEEKGVVQIEDYIKTINVFRRYTLENNSMDVIKIRVIFKRLGMGNTFEVTNYDKEIEENYNDFVCLYILNNLWNKISDISCFSEVELKVLGLPEYFVFDEPEQLQKFNHLKYLYMARNLSPEERRYIQKHTSGCTIN